MEPVGRGAKEGGGDFGGRAKEAASPEPAGSDKAADDAGAGRASLWQSVQQALLVSLQLAVYSVFGTAPLLLFWLPRRASSGSDVYKVNTTAYEAVILDRSYVGTLEFELLYFLCAFLPFSAFFASVLAYCIQLPWRRWLALLAPVLIYAASGTVKRVMDAEAGFVITGMLTLLPLAVQWGLFRFRFCPRDSKIPGLLVRFMVVISGSVLSITLIQRAPDSVAIFVLIPLFKEVTNFLMREIARRIALDASVGGAGVLVQRDAAWPVAAVSLLIFSIYTRLVYSRVQSTGVRNSMIAFQAACEIALRISVKWRDEQVRALLKRVRSVVGPRGTGRRRATVLVSPHLPRQPAAVQLSRAAVSALSKGADGPAPVMDARFVAHSLEERRASVDNFFANIIVLEALCEYTAILTVPLLILVFKDDVLVVPFEFYAAQDNPFSEPVDASPLLGMFLTQILAEFAVDTVCGAVEIRFGRLDLPRAWRERSKHFALWFIFASWFAQVVVAAFYNMDDLQPCFDQDMCVCLDNGLTPGGVRDLYCRHTLAHNASS